MSSANANKSTPYSDISFHNVTVNLSLTSLIRPEAKDFILTLINDGIESQQDVYLRCLLLPVLGLCGLVGNALNMVILSHHGFAETTNIILVSLSASDFFFSLSQIFRRARCAIQLFDVAAGVTAETLMQVYVIPFNTLMLVVSICHVVFISIERLFAVCFPFHVSRIYRKRRVKMAVLFLYAYPTVMGFPNLFRLTFEWVHEPKYNATVAKAKFTQFLTDHFDTIIMYGTVVFNNMFTTLSLAFIFACSVAVIVRLFTNRIRHSDLTLALTSKPKELRVMKTLLTVCFVCLVVCVPSTVLDMYILYCNSILDTSAMYHIGQSVNDILYQVNASVNFFIYVSMSSKFAKTYKVLFCKRKEAKPTF
ncbi:trace amine-associated receptor 3 [Biomphalaria glabrata]|nr:putative trace amine-associated receptor 3 [Biomphalaria glabrata]